MGGLDDFDEIPVPAKGVLPKELQAIAVRLNGAPGMGLYQIREIGFQVIGCQAIRAAIEKSSYPAQRTAVEIQCGLAFALENQGRSVFL